MLYLLSDPAHRVALLRLPDEGPMVEVGAGQRCRRAQCLRRRTHIDGVPVAMVRVVGASGLCGPAEEMAAAARLIAGGLRRLPTGHEVHTPWMQAPVDWLVLAAAEDVGWFPEPRTLTELARKNYLPRPRFPSDPVGAYDRVLAWRGEVRPSRLFPVRNVGPLSGPEDHTVVPSNGATLARTGTT